MTGRRNMLSLAMIGRPSPTCFADLTRGFRLLERSCSSVSSSRCPLYLDHHTWWKMQDAFSHTLRSDQLCILEKVVSNTVSRLGLTGGLVNFVLGKNNQLAYAIATAVAEKPGETYNPVFYY